MSENVSPMPQLTVLSMRQDLAGVAARLLLTVGCCCVHCSSGPQVSRLCFAGCATATVVLLRPPVVGSVAGCRCGRCSRRCSCRGSSVLPWAPLSVAVVVEHCGAGSVSASRRRAGEGLRGRYSQKHACVGTVMSLASVPSWVRLGRGGPVASWPQGPCKW